MTTAIASIFAAGSLSMPAQALTKDQVLSLSYEQVKGSGLANRCSEVKGSGAISVSGKAKIVDLCLEPTSWQVIFLSFYFNILYVDIFCNYLTWAQYSLNTII